jgi:hypothetical protein
LSYVDHSNFLRNSARYAFLFNFDKTDYKSWALGLRQAGYATNPSYTAMVIKNIEEYNLDQLDVSGSPKNVKLVKKQPKFLADEKITSNSESVSTNLPSSETNGKAEEKLSSDNNYPTVHWNVKNIDATPIVANAINVKRHPIYNSKKAKSQAYAKKKKTNNKTKSALAKNTKAKPIAKKSTASVANKKHSKNLTRN